MPKQRRPCSVPGMESRRNRDPQGTLNAPPPVPQHPVSPPAQPMEQSCALLQPHRGGWGVPVAPFPHWGCTSWGSLCSTQAPLQSWGAAGALLAPRSRMTMGNGPFGVPVCPGGLHLPLYPALLCTIPTAASPLWGLILHLPRRGTSPFPSVGFIFFPLNSFPLLSPCFSHPDVQCHQVRSGVWAPTVGAAGTFWVAPSAHPSSSHHGCAWYHHRGRRVVPGGSLHPQRVPAGSHEAGARGTGLTPSLLPNKRSLSWRGSAGRERGEGGENSKQNQSKRAGGRGGSWAKTGRSRGAGGLQG